MKIAESQLRKIIAEEISSLVEVETAGEKAAAAAIDATSMSTFESRAKAVTNQAGLQVLIMDLIKTSGIGRDIPKNKVTIKKALIQVAKDVEQQ